MLANQSAKFLQCVVILSMGSSSQDSIALDRAGALLSDELDGIDNLGSGFGVELLRRIAEDGGEDGDQLGCEGEDGSVLLLICK